MKSNIIKENLKMADVYIALGSNIGDRKRHLLKAINKIHSIGEIISIAPLYLSSAYGFFEQPDFYNSIVLLKTKLEPLKLLNKLKLIEVEVGRKNRIRWGPREIDLDIIFYNQEIIETNELTVPHPDFKNQGMAAFLLKNSINALLAHGYKELYLVVTQGNLEAQHLYEKIGFRVFE